MTIEPLFIFCLSILKLICCENAPDSRGAATMKGLELKSKEFPIKLKKKYRIEEDDEEESVVVPESVIRKSEHSEVVEVVPPLQIIPD